MIIGKVIMPDGEEYFSAFDAETGEKLAPWTDGDTREEVLQGIALWREANRRIDAGESPAALMNTSGVREDATLAEIAARI